MFRKQIIILALLMLPMIPGASKIPEIAKQTLSLQNDKSSETAAPAKQAFMTGKDSNNDSASHKDAHQEKDTNKTTNRQRYERARKTQDVETLKAMSKAEARRMMRTGDTQTYRNELQRYNLIGAQ